MSAFDKLTQKMNGLNKFAAKDKTPELNNIVNGAGNLEGWLLKRGDKGLAKALVELTWKKRLFRQEGMKLKYYTSPTAQTPKGELDMSEVLSVDSVQSPLFGINVVTKERTYVLRAQSHAERNLWIDMLRQRCPKVAQGAASPRVIAPDETTPLETVSGAAGGSGAGADLLQSLQSTTQQSPRYMNEDPQENQSSSSMQMASLGQTGLYERQAVAYAPGGIPIYADEPQPVSSPPMGMIVDPYQVGAPSSPRAVDAGSTSSGDAYGGSPAEMGYGFQAQPPYPMPH